MIGMFREHGMGNFRALLMRLSTSPAMMYYLDNTESHKVAVNENYGRELLELFSLGVGKDEAFNYSEDDVKACARAFTGWNNAPGYPPFPHGRVVSLNARDEVLSAEFNKIRDSQRTQVP